MFLEKMEKTLNASFNEAITDNGAIGFRTSGKNLLDFHFAITTFRGKGEKDIINAFMKAYYEEPKIAIKYLFYLRDIRGGCGERKAFRVILTYLSINHPEVIKNLIKYIPEYGRWDDVLCLLDSELKNEVMELIKSQLSKDVKNMHEKQPVSLLAKWMPSVNASSLNSQILSKTIAKHLNISYKEYRQTLSALRSYLDIVEIKMSKKEWDNIDYQRVPSKANLIYNSTFLKNDEDRRRDFLGKLENGEAKINAGTIFPHEIVHKYTNYNRVKPLDKTLEALWNALPDMVKGEGDTIVVADGSGSMNTYIPKTKAYILSAANALAIYFAERSKGEFRDKYITFSEKPQLVDFSKCNSLKEKIEVALLHNEVSNTNIEAVFDLILTTAIKNNLKQTDLPSNILIVSDMMFDRCAISDDGSKFQAKLFEEIASKFASHGYKLPSLIFWNLNVTKSVIPIIENDMGVRLLSGYSTSLINMVLSSKTDPYDALIEQLMGERYKVIE